MQVSLSARLHKLRRCHPCVRVMSDGSSPPPMNSDGQDMGPSSSHVTHKVLGVDYGRKWTGLAIGRGESCHALKVISSGDGMSSLSRQLLEIATEHGLNEVVVGYPVNPEAGNSLANPSKDTPIGRRCRDLANTLAILTRDQGLGSGAPLASASGPRPSISIFLYDEASTSADARLMMGSIDSSTRRTGFQSTREKHKNKEDALAAMLLVRRYLNKPGLGVRVRLR